MRGEHEAKEKTRRFEDYRNNNLEKKISRKGTNGRNEFTEKA